MDIGDIFPQNEHTSYGLVKILLLQTFSHRLGISLFPGLKYGTPHHDSLLPVLNETLLHNDHK